MTTRAARSASAVTSPAANPDSIRTPSSSGSHSHSGDVTSTPGRSSPASNRDSVWAFHGSWFAPPGVPPAQRGVPVVSDTTQACSVVLGRRPRSGKFGWPGSGVNPRPARLASVRAYSGTTIPLPNRG